MKDKEMKYLCNQACSVSKDKVTNDYFKVTCKNCKKILNKEKVEMIKEKKLTKNEWHIRFLKDDLEHKKRVYEVYIKALVKYNIKNVAYAAIMCDEYYHKELMRKMESLSNNGKGFCEFMFGNPMTEEEKIQDSIKYFDTLINHAQMKISMMDDETKTKIAKDAVEKGAGWLKLSGENYKDEKSKGLKCPKCGDKLKQLKGKHKIAIQLKGKKK